MLTFKDEKGQGLVEYALILVLVAVVVIVIIGLCALTPIVWAALVGLAIYLWPQIVQAGTWLVSGVQHGDPSATFVAILVGIIAFAIIFQPWNWRRR